jgi:peptidyl-prolyl cis-trans isomerase B (cyclophilin B)
MQPLELDEGGVAGGTAGHRHGPTSLPPRLRVKRRSWAAPAGLPRVTMTAMRPLAFPIALVLSAGLAGVAPTAAQTRRAAAAAPRVYTATLPIEQMRHKQAVVTTSLGDIVIELLPDAAPDHVGYLMKLAQEHAYDGTTFHRAILRGLIQGGDPLSRDPAKKAQYGTGGLGVLKFRANDLTHVRGAVSAVLRPGQPDSAGAQFFICVSDQPTLDGRFTVFGRVVEGLEIAQRISEMPADANGLLDDRVEIVTVRIRDTPPAEPTPFETETVAQLAGYRAVLETTMGEITLAFFPDRAPGHVRNFLRLAKLGVYDGTAFHRVVPGFVVQTGALTSRTAPLTQKQRPFVVNLAPEFNPTPHEAGILSMARGDDPGSAQTSFFICLGRATSLDNKYTVFGRVVDGMPVVEALAKVPLNGEEPVTRVEITRVRLVPPAP